MEDQRPTDAPPFASAGHLDTPLLQEYASHGFHVEVGPKWSLSSIHETISTVPHTSTLTPSAITFCWTEILDVSLRGFSIALEEDESICLIENLLRISGLAFVDQYNFKLRIICNF